MYSFQCGILPRWLTFISSAGSETVRNVPMPSERFSIPALQTATLMTWFMLAMIAYPDVQKKCQEELDRVIGRSRMPTFRDKESLPYIRATVRELFRWRATVPIGELWPNMNHFTQCIDQRLTGLPHSTTQVAFSRRLFQACQVSI